MHADLRKVLLEKLKKMSKYFSKSIWEEMSRLSEIVCC